MNRLQRFLPDIVFWALDIPLALPALWFLWLQDWPALGWIAAYLGWVLLVAFPIAYTIRHRLRRRIEMRELEQRWAKVVSDFYRPEAKR